MPEFVVVAGAAFVAAAGAALVSAGAGAAGAVAVAAAGAALVSAAAGAALVSVEVELMSVPRLQPVTRGKATAARQNGRIRRDFIWIWGRRLSLKLAGAR